MDPKNLPTLDPKLKEAYERVMATSLPSNPQTTTPAPQVSPAPSPTQPPPPVSVPPPITPPTAPSMPPPMPSVASQTTSAPAPTLTPAPHATSVRPAGNSTTFVAAPQQSGGRKMSPILLISAGVIFFLVYTLFWLRFFNVSLPFLP